MPQSWAARSLHRGSCAGRGPRAAGGQRRPRHTRHRGRPREPGTRPPADPRSSACSARCLGARRGHGEVKAAAAAAAVTRQQRLQRWQRLQRRGGDGGRGGGDSSGGGGDSSGAAQVPHPHQCPPSSSATMAWPCALAYVSSARAFVASHGPFGGDEPPAGWMFSPKTSGDDAATDSACRSPHVLAFRHSYLPGSVARHAGALPMP